jgi:hypothetical protein
MMLDLKSGEISPNGLLNIHIQLFLGFLSPPAKSTNLFMTKTPQLSRLVEADIAQAWDHEAHSFTPWLFANLDALGKRSG